MEGEYGRDGAKGGHEHKSSGRNGNEAISKAKALETPRNGEAAGQAVAFAPACPADPHPRPHAGADAL